jgi:hypothetical protein
VLQCLDFFLVHDDLRLATSCSRINQVDHSITVEVSDPEQRHLLVSRNDTVRLVGSQAVHLKIVVSFIDKYLEVILAQAVSSWKKQVRSTIRVEFDEGI